MKAKLYIILAMLSICISSIAQQRSYCEIVPIHLGKYPIYSIADNTNGNLGQMFRPDSASYIEVKPTELKIVALNKELHNLQYTSIPSSGIDYFMWDNKVDYDVPVYILYVKDENTKDKYFGIFIKYNENTEYVFTYKCGTQIE